MICHATCAEKSKEAVDIHAYFLLMALPRREIEEVMGDDTLPFLMC